MHVSYIILRILDLKSQVKLKERTSRIRQKQNNKEVTTQQRLYENERQQKYRKRSSISITSTIQALWSKLKEGPTYICCSCHLLLYRHNVKKFVNDNYSAALLADCTNNIDSFDHMRYNVTAAIHVTVFVKVTFHPYLLEICYNLQKFQMS